MVFITKSFYPIEFHMKGLAGLVKNGLLVVGGGGNPVPPTMKGLGPVCAAGGGGRVAPAPPKVCAGGGGRPALKSLCK
jgi:hypothetical protein